ncbi:MAG: rhomboid family intramembrane serine protease [Flavobacteriales bacterium]
MHADGYHLFVNMFVLYMFGANVERLYPGLTDGSGALAFSGSYLGGILFSSLVVIGGTSTTPAIGRWVHQVPWLQCCSPIS